MLAAAAVALLVAGLAGWSWTPDLDRRTLEAKYLAAPGDLRQVAGVALHVRISGPPEAPAVLLIHGFGASLHTWEPWARVLANDHRVVRFDLPGSGLSGPDPSGRYTDARTEQVLLALMDQLGLARASLIGHSIGGRIAWTFAAHHPERVDKLVLVAPDGFAGPGLAYGQPPDIPAMTRLFTHVLPRAVLRHGLAPAYADPRRLTEATVDRYHDLLRAPGARAAWIARWQQTVLLDPEPLLRSLRMPVLLVWGEQDAMIPFAHADDYRRRLPDVRLASLPGVGHLPHEEAPDLSIRPVVDFLR